MAVVARLLFARKCPRGHDVLDCGRCVVGKALPERTYEKERLRVQIFDLEAPHGMQRLLKGFTPCDLCRWVVGSSEASRKHGFTRRVHMG